MTRYLRNKAGDVYIWDPILAKRKDFEEVFARNVEEAKKGLSTPVMTDMSAADVEKLTKAQLIAFAFHRLDTGMDPDMKREDMVYAIQDALGLERSFKVYNPQNGDLKAEPVVEGSQGDAVSDAVAEEATNGDHSTEPSDGGGGVT